MSENKHTAEPWYSSNEGENYRVMAADENGGYTLADMCCDEQEANARRIVACINACAGISIERLEKFLGATANKSVITLTTDNIDLKKQRDELLAALEKMNRAYVILMESARDRICDLSGECDGIEVMERNDPYLRESRAVIASMKGNHSGDTANMVETAAPAIVFYPAGSLGEPIEEPLVPCDDTSTGHIMARIIHANPAEI